MEHIVYLMEYHRMLRATKEESYQRGLSTSAVTEVMDNLSAEIRRLKWERIYYGTVRVKRIKFI